MPTCVGVNDGDIRGAYQAEQYYTVKSGDTLSGIAAKYGTNDQHLAQLNGIAIPKQNLHRAENQSEISFLK